MTNIERFNKGEIGLDFKNSFKEDIEELSVFSVGYEGRRDVHTLKDYVQALMHTDFKVILYDDRYKSLNAYSQNMANEFISTHPFMTADEILEREKEQDISETEFELLFME